MIPSDIKFDGNATPQQWTNNEDVTIEKGTHVRIKLMGIRWEINQFFAIATIKEASCNNLWPLAASEFLLTFLIGLPWTANLKLERGLIPTPKLVWQPWRSGWLNPQAILLG